MTSVSTNHFQASLVESPLQVDVSVGEGGGTPRARRVLTVAHNFLRSRRAVSRDLERNAVVVGDRVAESEKVETV